MRLPCVALLLLPLLAAAFLQHAPARNDNARQLPQPPHMLLAAARSSRVAASPKLAVKQLGAATAKSKRAAAGATVAAAAAPKAASASKAKSTAGTSKRKAAAKVGVASKAKAVSSAASSIVRSTALAAAKKTPGVRATTAKSTVAKPPGPAINDSFQQLEALFNQADTKDKPERALAASTAHLLLQLLTTGLKADHTKLLRDLLLELLYTVNKMLKKVEHMPDHGLFVRAENSKVPSIANK